MKQDDPTLHEIRIHLGSKTIVIKATYYEYDGVIIAENDLNRILEDIKRDIHVTRTSYVDEFNVTHELKINADRIDMVELIKGHPSRYRDMSVLDQYRLVA